MQELPDLWRATTPDVVNVFGDFSSREFAAALHHLKPGKTPCSDSICQQLSIHAGPGLKFYLRDFFSSCLRQLKIPKVWRRALVIAIPKPSKPVELPSHLSALRPLQDPRTTDHNCVKTIVDLLLPTKQAGLRNGKSTVDQVALLTQNIEDSLRQKRRLVPCLSIWQLLMTLPGTVVSLESC